MTKREDLVFIKHVLDAINDIKSSIKGSSKENFIRSKDLKDATIRRIEIIGEAVKNISESTKKKYHKVEWKKIIGTRDRLIHAYFSVDLDIIWDIIKNDLPVLERQLLKIKKYLDKDKLLNNS